MRARDKICSTNLPTLIRTLSASAGVTRIFTIFRDCGVSASCAGNIRQRQILLGEILSRNTLTCFTFREIIVKWMIISTRKQYSLSWFRDVIFYIKWIKISTFPGLNFKHHRSNISDTLCFDSIDILGDLASEYFISSFYFIQYIVTYSSLRKISHEFIYDILREMNRETSALAVLLN